MNNGNNFFEWFGGLVDASGNFYVSKKGYGCIEVIMHKSEIQTLHFIKKNCGGSISSRKGVQAVRWRLHKEKQVLLVCEGLLGHIHTLKRQAQFKKICETYKLDYKIPECFTYENAWFSGFFCGEGCLYINKKTFQVTLSVSQKEKYILCQIQKLYNGNIFFDISWYGWVWQVTKMADCNQLLNYFHKNPLRNPYKQAKTKSIERFLIYKEKGYHLDILKRKKLLHYIKVFEIKKD